MRSTTTRAVSLALVAVVSLGGCGASGSDDESKGTGGELSAIPDGDEVGAVDEVPGVFEDCEELVKDWVDAAIAPTQFEDGVERAKELLRQLADGGPEELRDDFTVLVESYGSDDLSDGRYLEATSSIDRWLETHCADFYG